MLSWKKQMKRKSRWIPAFLVLGLIILQVPVFAAETEQPAIAAEKDTSVTPGIEKDGVTRSRLEISKVTPYDDTAFEVINDNIPDFYISQITTEPYVNFSALDKQGRTGAGMACLSKETLPKEARTQISNITPVGWQNERYDDLIVNQYLYNRSHIIGYQLCGDNATPENLFTGTDYLNTESMLYFENLIAEYLDKNAKNHVIYRVTPLYKDKNLVADGVQMEAFSVEDFGKGVCFNVFVYNVQPGVTIDYATGKSKADAAYVPGSAIGVAQMYGKVTEPEIVDFKMAAAAKPEGTKAKVAEEQTKETTVAEEPETTTEPVKEVTYILNTNTKKFHYPNCASVGDMKEKNKSEFYGSRDEAIAAGYDPCGRCHP